MNDPKLLRSAAEGDLDALTAVIRELAQTVYSYHLGMLGDEREAEDAMQETFVRVTRALGRYDEDSEPTPWIFAVARRVAADLRPTPSAPPTDAPDGHDTDWVRRALRALPLELREVLVFREMMRWDVPRIASTLGVAPDDVESRLLAAKTQLAENVSGQT